MKLGSASLSSARGAACGTAAGRCRIGSILTVAASTGTETAVPSITLISPTSETVGRLDAPAPVCS